MSALDDLIKQVKDRFWQCETYLDNGELVQNGIVGSCAEVVGGRIRSPRDYRYAANIIMLLAKANMPLALEAADMSALSRQQDWGEFFCDLIEASLTAHLKKTDKRMNTEDERRWRLYA